MPTAKATLLGDILETQPKSVAWAPEQDGTLTCIISCNACKKEYAAQPRGLPQFIAGHDAVSGLVGTTNIETAYPSEFQCGTVPRCAYHAASHA